ncbi:hypothetical protein [Kribbella sp. NPDC051137]|uniref:hypothetical protein n=1 Tax=Kribbella sp. NPDC051137 TaxID=3155045 RepID=UPI00343756C7
MNRAEYNALMAAGEAGTKLAPEAFAELAAFAKEKKVKRPRPEWVLDEPRATEPPAEAEAETPAEKPARKRAAAKKPAKESTRTRNKGETCVHVGEDGKPDCDSDARARGLCSKHHTAWYRANVPGAQDRAREASARYAAKVREAKQLAKAGAEQ